MSDWRFIAARVNGDGTDTVLDHNLPLSDATVTTTLSGPDAVSGTLSPDTARLKTADGLPLVQPWSTAIYAEVAGQLRAGGIVVPPLTMAGSKLSLECVGFVGYAKDQPYDGDRSRVKVDPMDEARHIWAHLQSRRRGDLGLVLDDTTSDVTIGTEKEDVEFTTGAGEDVAFEAGPYTLTYWSTSDLGQAFDDLAANTPFDYREEHSWDGDRIAHFLRLGYPKLGRRRHDLRFVVGENVSLIPEITSGDDYADEVWLLGAGEGRKMVRGVAHRNDTRLRRVTIVSDKTIRSKKNADQRASREVARRIGMADVTELQVHDHEHARVGTWANGDEIRVIVPETAGWAGNTDLWCRVLATELSPATTGAKITVSRVDKVEAT